MTSDDAVLQFAIALGPPPERLADTEAVTAALAAEGAAWAHLKADAEGTDEWIDRHLGYLPEAVHDALIAAETRPRSVVIGDGVLLNLRGVNFNPGADPEDMIAIRIWADRARVVSLTRRDLRSVDEVADAILRGGEIETAGALLAELSERLTEKIAEAVRQMEDLCDAIEASMISGEHADLRARIADLRQDVLEFRRFLVPMREAVADLIESGPEALFSDHDRLELGESLDRLRRSVESVESLREQLMVFRDELQSRSDELLNRNLYILSVVSAVFLPLGFLTGLMGINLAGIPGAAWPPAFWIFTAALIILMFLVLLALWRLHFFRR